MYRSYKGFNEENFKRDLESIPFHVAEMFATVDDTYWLHEKLITRKGSRKGTENCFIDYCSTYCDLLARAKLSLLCTTVTPGINRRIKLYTIKSNVP